MDSRTVDPLSLLRVEHRVDAALVQSRTGAESFERSLHAVAEEMGWEHAGLWLQSASGRLKCVNDWHADGSQAEKFSLQSRGLRLEVGEGLPGRVWGTGFPVWIADLSNEPNLPRAAAAAAAGLRSAIAFPLLGRDGVLAVVEVFSASVQEPDEALTATLVSIGRRVGQFVEQRRAEEAVRESEARKRAILDAALDCVITIDHEGRVVEANAALELVFGYSPEEAAGREMAELVVPPELRRAHRDGLARILAGEAPRVMGRRVELIGMRKDGTRVPIELAITRIQTTGPPLFTGHVRDISDRKQAVEELRASRQRIVEAGDVARRRVERDLHDGAQQRLVAVAIGLRLAQGQLAEDPAAAGELLREARSELDAATAELRELARGIHPAVLTDRGLGAAVAGLARRAAQPVNVQIELTERLPARVESAAYFVVAEALANSTRYAGAEQIDVTAAQQGGMLTVTICDDGIGGADLSSGTGLGGLVDRLAALDGKLEVRSAQGHGTTVRAEIPCG